MFKLKQEYYDLYMPEAKPCIILVPRINYLMVRGRGNPYIRDGEYRFSIILLFSVLSELRAIFKDKGNEFVVPLLETFWWKDNDEKFDYVHKEELNFVSTLRLPYFVSEDDFKKSIESATLHKEMSFSKVEFITYEEGMCVQCICDCKVDDEQQIVRAMNKFIKAKGYEPDITMKRKYHEIYLTDPRRHNKNNMKILIRQPIKNINGLDYYDIKSKKKSLDDFWKSL